MNIIYQQIDVDVLDKIAAKYGDWAKKHIHLENGSYALVALNDNIPVGFISTYTKQLIAPLAHSKDAYIDVIEVDEKFQRQGIASELIKYTEKWAQCEKFTQIRAWSSQDKVEAIQMWHALGYCMCPSKIWVEWCKEVVDGYYVVKQLNPSNPYPDVANFIKKDIFITNGRWVHDLRLLSAKNGVYVFKCTYNGVSAVVKYFEKFEDKREIKNYRILNENGIPTINAFAIGESSIVMEDIDLSTDWRLGVTNDLQDIKVAKSLANWYFNLHEKGAAVPELDTLYCEYDSVTESSIEELCTKLPEGADTFRYILARYQKLRKWIVVPSYTLTYNDFYWTNFVVSKDKQAALMFDYNLLGRGYRYADIRNVCSSLSENSCKTFVDEYNRIYKDKHGVDRTQDENREEQIDKVVSCLVTLIVAFKRRYFPGWADNAKKEALDGILLHNAKSLLE